MALFDIVHVLVITLVFVVPFHTVHADVIGSGSTDNKSTSAPYDDDSVTVTPPFVGVQTEAQCSPCKCSKDGDKLTVDCSGKQLVKIPDKLPKNTNRLIFDDNRLVFSSDASSLQENHQEVCEYFKELHTLSLARNSLKRLPPIFKGCNDTLKELNLSGNTLSQLYPEDFRPLSSLVTLKGLTFSGELSKNLFDALKRLEEMELSYDGLDLHPNLFAGLLHLHSLRLDLPNMLTVADVPLKTSSLKEFHITGPKIMTIPRDFFSGLGRLRSLNLKLDGVDSLDWPRDIFSSLKHLTVQGVDTVTGDSLTGMTSLQTLRLMNLYSLDTESLLKNQEHLEFLEITGSRIHSLSGSSFPKLVALKELNLSDNRIAELHTNALSGLSNLKSLTLSHNRIMDIPQGFFDPVADHLETLSLDSNNLKSLPNDSFPAMKNLMAFDISHNILSRLDLDLFRDSSQLAQLQLQENRITELSGSLVSGVQRINLSGNRLDSLPSGILIDSLLALDISRNPMTRGLVASDIIQLPELKELSIFDLTVKCDCEMQRVVQSKTIRGGRCRAEYSQSTSKTVADILNEPICESTSAVPTTLTSGNVFIRTLQSDFYFADENTSLPVEGQYNRTVTSADLANYSNGTSADNATLELEHLSQTGFPVIIEDINTTRVTLSETTMSTTEADGQLDVQIHHNETELTGNASEGNSSDSSDIYTTSVNNATNKENDFLKEAIANISVSKTLPKESEKGGFDPIFLFPISAIIILVFIFIAILLVRRFYRSGSANLMFRRRLETDDDDDDRSEEGKMVMTELGKCGPGKETVVIM